MSQETKETDFNSVESPAKRDLMAEMAEACDKKGLGLLGIQTTERM